MKAQYDDAILCFNKLIEINPNHESGYYGLGYAYYNKSMFDESISCYNK